MINLKKALMISFTLGVLSASSSNAQESLVVTASPQQIADHFSNQRTLSGKFVQFGPRGEQTGGTFYLSRPGKIRFNYDKTSPIEVISDGKSVVVHNKKLDSWDLYPLNKTPLKLLLADKIELTGEQIKSVQQETDTTTIVLGDKTAFGSSKISLMFDTQSLDLKQWTITDAQNLDTTVMIFNVKSDVELDKKLFAIDYLRVHAPNKN
jgi:outer membrane lipoprotein-sorting protein